MTLHKLTLSIGLLAASLMLAAPAQAETWSCSYIVDLKEGSKSYSWIFVRDGAGFRGIAHSGDQYKYDVIMENEDAIHLYSPRHPKRKGSLFVIGMFKKAKKFVSIHLDNVVIDNQTIAIRKPVTEGQCVIH